MHCLSSSWISEHLNMGIMNVTLHYTEYKTAPHSLYIKVFSSVLIGCVWAPCPLTPQVLYLQQLPFWVNLGFGQYIRCRLGIVRIRESNECGQRTQRSDIRTSKGPVKRIIECDTTGSVASIHGWIAYSLLTRHIRGLGRYLYAKLYISLLSYYKIKQRVIVSRIKSIENKNTLPLLRPYHVFFSRLSPLVAL